MITNKQKWNKIADQLKVPKMVSASLDVSPYLMLSRDRWTAIVNFCTESCNDDLKMINKLKWNKIADQLKYQRCGRLWGPECPKLVKIGLYFTI